MLEKRKVISLIGIILFIMTPLLSAVLFCLKDGKMIWDVYLPLGGWSDEITYYKQIEGILAYGMPRGYFGYNQSSALYGTLGVWGLLPLLPYCLWGGYIWLELCVSYLCEYFFLYVSFGDSLSAASTYHETGRSIFSFLVFKSVYKSLPFIRCSRSVRNFTTYSGHCYWNWAFVRSEEKK